MFKESDVAYENSKAWVLKDKKNDCYTVFIIGNVASESDSTYPLNDDGLSIAIARAKYLEGRK